MQNLATMNLVDVILHTRVPPGRLVDWTDQAFLLIHLDRVELTERRTDGHAPARLKLRRVADLLKAFSEEQGRRRVFVLPEGVLPPLPVSQLRLLVAVLAAEPGLTPVWNWQRNGVPSLATV
jgi:hypothetical protein